MTYINGFDFVMPIRFLREVITSPIGKELIQSWKGKIESKVCDIETVVSMVNCEYSEDDNSVDNVNGEYLLKISFMNTSIPISADHQLRLNLSHAERIANSHMKTTPVEHESEKSELVEKIVMGVPPSIQKETPQNNELGLESAVQKCVPKKKRGRPRKCTKEKVKLDTTANTESVECTRDSITSNSVASNRQDIVIEPLNEASGAKRYSLRGVKLCESIMNAEKGVKFISSKEKEVHSSQSTVGSNLTSPVDKSDDMELVTKGMEGTIMEEAEIDSKENFSSDVKKELHVNVDEIDDIEVDEDQDYVAPDYVYDSSYEQQEIEEEEYKPYTYKKKSKHLLKERAKNMLKRKRQKLDLGDIPQFERRKKNTEKIKACKYCSKLFCDYTGVEEHIKKFHMEETDVNDYLEQLQPLKVVTCKICGQKFQSRIILQDHENRVHYRTGSVKCHKCGKTYKNVQSLRNHIRAIHYMKGQSHLCHLCPAKFKWQATLQQHINEIHLGKSDILCKICGKTFARNNQLNRHMRSHGVDQSKRLICQQCGKGFWFDYNLKRHMEVIHGPHLEKYHCSYCGKGFNLKGGMVTHVQQTHFNIFPFQCPVESCRMGFARQKLLTDHMQQTHPYEKYEPAEPQRGRYKYGRSTEDLFYCSHCSVSFCYKAKLVEHMHIAHSDSFPHKCDKCSQGFLEKSFLLYHLKKAHDVDIDDEEIQMAKVKKISKDESDRKFKIVTLSMEGDQVQICQVEEPQEDTPENLVVASQEVGQMSQEDNSLPHLEQDQTSSYTLDLNAAESNTIHYVIEDGAPAVLPEELANLLLAAGQTIDIGQSGEIELTTKTINDGTETVTYISQGIDEFSEENVVETVEETADIISDSLC